MFSNLINEEAHENIIWPDIPYLTDEHGSKWRQGVSHLCVLLNFIVFGWLNRPLNAVHCRCILSSEEW